MSDTHLIHELLLRLIDNDDAKLLVNASNHAEAHVKTDTGKSWSSERRLAEYRAVLRGQLTEKVAQACELANIIDAEIAVRASLNVALGQYKTDNMEELVALVRGSGDADCADSAEQIEHLVHELRNSPESVLPAAFYNWFLTVKDPENKFLPKWAKTKTRAEKDRISQATLTALN